MKALTRTKAIAALVVVGLLAVGFASPASGSAAVAKAKGKKANRAQKVAGAVTALDDTSVTVETKKSGSRKFELTNATSFKLKTTKDGEAKPAVASDLKVGGRVQITAAGGTAKEIVIMAKQRKQKKVA